MTQFVKVVDWIGGRLSFYDFNSTEKRVAKIAADFPALFERSRADWALFKLGVSRGLFTAEDKKAIVDWYQSLFAIWDGVRPNWMFTPDGLVSSRRAKFADEVDAWILKVKGEKITISGLGFPILIVGGIVIASLLTGGALAGWLKQSEATIAREKNKSDRLNARLAGTISADEFKAAQEAESAPGFFDQLQRTIGGAATLGIVGALAVLFGPQIKSAVQKAIR